MTARPRGGLFLSPRRLREIGSDAHVPLVERPVMSEFRAGGESPDVAGLGLRTRLAMLRRAPYLGFVGMGMTFGSATRPVAGGVTR